MSLVEYDKKRKFSKTTEPKGKIVRLNDGLSEFVVQKHAARSLHYDLRLEYKGILLSWAVPKGLSLNPSIKRFATKVEDHPFDYREFEGVIPEGNYGAGTVMVWDHGYFSAHGRPEKSLTEKKMEEGLKKEYFSFFLAGQKLRGGFVIAKIANSKNDWIVYKKKDKFAIDQTDSFDQNSAISGRSMDEILLGKPSLMPHAVKPMMASVMKQPFNKKDWIFEIKWDGYRAIAELENGKAILYSRNLKSYNDKFPEIIHNLIHLKKDAIFDGEIVALNQDGKADFQLLQDYSKRREGKIVYYVFDLLYLDGYDLRAKPLIERKNLLKSLISNIKNIKYSDHIEEKGKDLFKAAIKAGVEGIMSKDAKSPYLSGKRSWFWVKIKQKNTTEAIVVGYTEPENGRKYFGALIMGMYDASANLKFVGRVGTGFDDKKIEELHEKFQPLRQASSPFPNGPDANTPVTWIKPVLVCSIRFSNWTKDGKIRQPVFLGLRDDVDPSEVVKNE